MRVLVTSNMCDCAQVRMCRRTQSCKQKPQTERCGPLTRRARGAASMCSQGDDADPPHSANEGRCVTPPPKMALPQSAMELQAKEDLLDSIWPSQKHAAETYKQDDYNAAAEHNNSSDDEEGGSAGGPASSASRDASVCVCFDGSKQWARAAVSVCRAAPIA